MATLTSAQLIAAIHDARGLLSVAAQRLGISRQTLYNRAEGSPAVKAAIQEARELTTDVAEAKLFEAINEGEPWAITMYLKSVGKSRGYVERQEVLDLDLAQLSDEAVERIAGGEDPLRVVAGTRSRRA